ncbi:MAG: hypothetical protein H6834_12130 [Planctomycetes bacterium]|nr:hypothetical protein [Planctomycetota bacterium]
MRTEDTATTPERRLAAHAEHVAMRETSLFAEQSWQFLGPTNISGRVTDIAVPTPRGTTYTMYVATASGGVWRTNNEGTTFEPIFENEATASIGDLAVDPRDAARLWVGTGEANIFRSSMAGCGVYLTEDGGATWQHKGLAATHTIARIIVHPEDSNVVYVAATGHEWTDNDERGVYKTTDGGTTWKQVLAIDARTGANDLVMDPRDPNVLYAATWQRIRRRWNDPRVEEGYTKNGLWKTTDGGAHWTPITQGLPAPEHRGRIGIDLCLAQPDTLYAFVDCYDLSPEEPEGTDSYGRPRQREILGAQVYRSDDAGATWRKVSPDDQRMRRLAGTYGWVFGQIRVDPKDAETLYVMGIPLVVSNDGGQSFRTLRGMHGDHHALWIDPHNGNYLVNGNDGGLAISYDGGEHWRTFYEELPAVQFYNVGYDMDEPFHVYGSIQDHGSRRAVVDLSRGRDRIRAQEWEWAPGGEASHQAADPTDPNTVYSTGFYGRLQRTDMTTRDRAGLLPDAPEGQGPWRGQWLAPFIVSPHNPRILYHGMNVLMRSLDRGENLTPISGDLTGNDEAQLGDIPFQTIFTISESPRQFGLLYTGSDDGHVYRTEDSGRTWHAITEGLVPGRWIARVEASRHDLRTVYLAQNGKRWDDFRALLWESNDAGETWRDISSNLPDAPINVIREDAKNENVLYVGTDLGAYVSVDAGTSWHTLGKDLPITYVHDLVVHPRDDVIVIATHGRGMFALDAHPIQRFGREADDEDDEAEATPRRRGRRGGRDDEADEDGRD